MQEPSLALLRYTHNGPVYVVGMDVFVNASARCRTPGTRRVLTLAAEAQRLVEWASLRQQAFPLLVEACDYAEHDAELQLCFRHLIPYLRFLSTGDEADLQCPVALDAMLHDFEQQAAHARSSFKSIPRQPIEAADLARLLGAPCMIDSQMVTPLESGSLPEHDHLTINLNSCCFFSRPEKARPLHDVIALIEDAARSAARCDCSIDVGTQSVAESLVAAGRRIVEYHNPRSEARCQVLHHDCYHQLQYSRGSCVLVRGPVKRISDREPVYVGFVVRGTKREQLLATRPHAAQSFDGFWTRAGIPTKAGMCMGNGAQYRHLLDSTLTPAEAVVHWLDAGVIVVTGRWRNRARLHVPRIGRSLGCRSRLRGGIAR